VDGDRPKIKTKNKESHKKVLLDFNCLLLVKVDFYKLPINHNHTYDFLVFPVKRFYQEIDILLVW
jgi:hypothetical protein